MKSKNVFAALIVLLISSISFAQTADEIINKHLSALGGKDKIEKVKSMKMTGNLDIGPDMKAPFTIYLKDGNKFLFEMEMQGMKIIQALNVDSGWYINPF